MDSKTNHFSLNHLQKTAPITTPSAIKTSKNWVLPPRPRPGRKPNASTAGSPPHASAEKPKKQYKKKSGKASNQPGQLSLANQTDNNEILNSFNNNPVELALKKIKDENKQLKLELSKLVSDLKSLQHQETHDETLHKKRNHVEMETVPSQKAHILDQLMENGSDEDDLSSQMSTPSLMSSHSSIMLHQTNSLSSIQEDEVLNIDDFLTASYFDDNTNSITKQNLDIQEQQHKLHLQSQNQLMGLRAQSAETKINPLKSNLRSPMLSPPSLPMHDSNDDFEFKFLEQEKPVISKINQINTNYDPLFEMPSESNDVFNWDWK